MRIGSLFSGYGGLEMGVQSVIGGEVAWHVEFDPAPSKILAHRFPGVPNHGDITKVDWLSVEPVDVLTGGFPCQDLSLAGRRSGMRPGTRSGLWADYLKAIDALRPRLAVIENVRGLLSGCAESEVDSDLGSCPRCADPESGVAHAPNVRALGRVLLDLATIGYDARWLGVRAADAGAPHPRYRVFVIANPASGRDQDRALSSGSIELVPLAGPSVGTDAWGTSPGVRDGRRDAVRLASLEDAHLATRDPWGQSAPGQAEGRWSWADARGRGGTPTADTGRGDERRGVSGLMGGAQGPRKGDEGQREWDGYSVADRVAATRAWGPYAAAVTRWESVIGRVAPSPTEPTGKGGAQRLSPVFVEWMMGLPAGWLTAPEVGLTRAQQLKALGNGVVPQQAALAVRTLLQAEEMAA